MTKELYIVLAIMAGVILTVQSGLNAQLNILIKNNAILSAFVSFVIGLIALTVILLITTPKAFQQIPIPVLPTGGNFSEAYSAPYM